MKVKGCLLVFLLALLIALPVSAGTWTPGAAPKYLYDTVFDKTVNQAHGIAVDRHNRIWMGSYGAVGILVKNPDGTSAPFSPIESVTIPGGAILGGDTTIVINTGNCRGMAVDVEGNILYAKGAALIKINAETGEGMKLWIGTGSLLKPAVDAGGYIYVGKVVGVNPVAVLDPTTFQLSQTITLPRTAGYARGMEVTADGKKIITANLTVGGPVYIYTTEDYITYSLTDSIFTNASGDTIFSAQCVTVNWGPDSTLWVSDDAAYGGDQAYNGLGVFDLKTGQYGFLYMPLDSTEVNGPRGVAFSATGDTAYVASFNANKVWRFVKGEPPAPGNWTFAGLADYKFDAIFDTTVSSTHGIAVDRHDRIWMGSYGAVGILVKNPDGTSAPFSPIESVIIPGGAKLGGDTTIVINTGNCRGMAVDHEGNILYAKGAALIKINAETGAGMKLWIGTGSLLKPAVDAAGYIYMGKVVGVNPVAVLDPATFQLSQTITLPRTAGYARGMEVTADGKTLWTANLNAHGPAYGYTTTDFVNYPLTDSLFGDKRGQFVLNAQAVTLNWGPDSTLWVSDDNAYGGDQLHNALKVFNFKTMEYKVLYMPAPADSAELTGPRGVAFSANGEYAYVGSFNASKVWRFQRTGVGVEERPIAEVPTDYVLSQNYPNPFNPTTRIPFTLKKNGLVELKVYNNLGQEVTTLVRGPMEEGRHEVIFDGTGLASGVYHYRLSINGVVLTKRMLLVK